MKKSEQSIIAFCMVLSAIVFLVAVCVFSYHLISTSVESQAYRRPANKTDKNVADMEVLSPEEKRLQVIFDEIDAIRKKQRKVRSGKVGSFDELSNDEKNRVWWEVVSIAQKIGEDPDPVQYKLTVSQAMWVSDRYGPSELEVYLFLREGIHATWRSLDPPKPLKKKS